MADVLSACYSKDAIDKIVFPDTADDLRSGGGAPRIDPKFVNNPELSDIQFRVEGRIFYAHKLGTIQIFKYLLTKYLCFQNFTIASASHKQR